MSTTTDIIAIEDGASTGILTAASRLFGSFLAAQKVAAIYQQTQVESGQEREIFDRTFDRI